MTREEMMNKVISTLGFEHKYTIWFCELAENPTVSDDNLAIAMTVALTAPVDEDDDC